MFGAKVKTLKLFNFSLTTKLFNILYISYRIGETGIQCYIIFEQGNWK